VGIINPSEFEPLKSIDLVVWVALGGRGTLYGAALGAVIVNYAKTWMTGAFPEVWPFALGGLFILVTLSLPKGVVGLVRSLPYWLASRVRYMYHKWGSLIRAKFSH
jgi:urea transport system permease protein